MALRRRHRGRAAGDLPRGVDFGLRAYQGTSKLLELSSVNVSGKPFVKARWASTTRSRSGLSEPMYVRASSTVQRSVRAARLPVDRAGAQVLGDSMALRLTTLIDLDDGSNVATRSSPGPWSLAVQAVLGAWVYGRHHAVEGPLDYAARSKFGQKAAGAAWRSLRQDHLVAGADRRRRNRMPRWPAPSWLYSHPWLLDCSLRRCFKTACFIAPI